MCGAKGKDAFGLLCIYGFFFALLCVDLILAMVYLTLSGLGEGVFGLVWYETMERV